MFRSHVKVLAGEVISNPVYSPPIQNKTQYNIVITLQAAPFLNILTNILIYAGCRNILCTA